MKPPVEKSSPRLQARTHSSPRRAPRHLCAGHVVSIEDIRVGDHVYAWDAAAGKLVKKPVRQLFRHADRAVIDVVCASSNGIRETVRCTTEHPFWVKGQGWVAARRLAPGDELRSIAASTTLHVVSVEDPGIVATVFNFEVEDVHNYHVGSLGILVHNMSDQGTQAAPLVTRENFALDPFSNNPSIRLSDVNHTIGEYGDPTWKPDGKPTSIATIRGVDYVLTERAPMTTRQFLEDVVTGRNYLDEAQLHQEAYQWEQTIGVERAMIADTKAALQDTSSPEFRVSAQMAAAAREIYNGVQLGKTGFALGDLQLRQELSDGIQDPASAAASSGVSNRQNGWTTARDPAALSAYDMIVNGRQGPLSPAQLRFGAELLSTGALLTPSYDASVDLSGWHAVKGGRVAATRVGHSQFTPTGMDISGDMGANALRTAGLSIGSGTSGTSSDTALLQKWAQQSFGVEIVPDGLRPDQAADAAKNVLLYFFREQVVPQAMLNGFNAPGRARQARGLEPMTMSDPTNVPPHTVGEMALGYDLTMEGRTNADAAAIDRIVGGVRSRVDAYRARLDDTAFDAIFSQ